MGEISVTGIKVKEAGSPGWRGLICRWKGSVRSDSFHPWNRIDGERVRGAPRRAPDTPGSRPTKSPLRGSLASVSSLQVGRDTASCLSRPHPRIPAGMTWLVNSGSAILMPDPTPQLSDFYVLQDGFCRCEITPPIHAFLFIFPYS